MRVQSKSASIIAPFLNNGALLPLLLLLILQPEPIQILLPLLPGLILEVILITSKDSIPDGEERGIITHIMTMMEVMILSRATHRQQPKHTPAPLIATMPISRLPHPNENPHNHRRHVDRVVQGQESVADAGGQHVGEDELQRVGVFGGQGDCCGVLVVLFVDPVEGLFVQQRVHAEEREVLNEHE